MADNRPNQNGLERVTAYEDDISFYNCLKDIVWHVKVDAEAKQANSRGHFVCFDEVGTGFALSSDGHIMTCSHIFPDASKYDIKIRARKTFGRDKFLSASILCNFTDFDIVLLKVEGINYPYGRLAGDGSLGYGDNVYHIGNPIDFPGSYVKGNVAYPCVKNMDIRYPLGQIKCANYVCTTSVQSPPYRMMGHVWNSAVLNEKSVQKLPFCRELDAHTPILQMCGGECGSGSSGGPVFNNKGEIAGMYVIGAEGFNIAVHVSLLNLIWNEHKGSSSQGQEIGGSSSRGSRRRK